MVGRDSGGLSDTVKVTVTITDVNERPNVSGSTTVSVPERTKPVATYTGAIRTPATPPASPGPWTARMPPSSS